MCSSDIFNRASRNIGNQGVGKERGRTKQAMMNILDPGGGIGVTWNKDVPKTLPADEAMYPAQPASPVTSPSAQAAPIAATPVEASAITPTPSKATQQKAEEAKRKKLLLLRSAAESKIKTSPVTLTTSGSTTKMVV
jgi:hypothetical protein